MQDRRDFLKRSFGFLAALAAGPAILDKLCAAPVAKASTDAGALFAAALRAQEPLHILDVIEGPAVISGMELWSACKSPSLAPVFCSLRRDNGTGAAAIVDLTIHPNRSGAWSTGTAGYVSVPAGQSVTLIAETTCEDAEIAGRIYCVNQGQIQSFERAFRG